jgi:DNA-binding winged helix-turn-helix (wHTH) protein
MRYAFDDFVLDGDTRELLRGGRVVPVSPKGLDFLELLLRERPRAVSTTRLRAALWPRTHVGATSLHVLVSQVRAALDDVSKQPRFVRTVQRFGYAFCGAVSGAAARDQPSAEGGVFSISTADGDFRLSPGDNVLGREAGLAVRIDRPGVSRRHALIRVEADQATLSDLDSKNGTFVAGQQVKGPTPLRDGDELRLGLRATVVFRRGAADDTETEASS